MRASPPDVSPAAVFLKRSGYGFWWTALTALALLCSLVLVHLDSQYGPLLPGERTISDNVERGVFFERGLFYPRGERAYVDVFSEYPALATLAFAIPFVFDSELDIDKYGVMWSYFMGLVFLLMLWVLQESRRGLGLDLWPIIVMASPGILYFSLNRFDLLPAMVCCTSLLAFSRKSYLAAYVLLGIGVHVKWYPAVIAPVYVAYHLNAEGLIGSRFRGFFRSQTWFYTGAFLSTVFALVGASIFAFGWEGFLVPYAFHGGRESQFLNAYWVVHHGMESLGFWQSSRSAIDLLFILAQLSILPILFFGE